MFHGVTDDTLARANAVLGNQDTADRLRAQALRTYRRIGASWWSARLARWEWEPAPRHTTRHFHPSAAGVWSIGDDPAPSLVPDMKGLHYLHRLLQRPGQDIRAVDLVASVTGVLASQGDLGEVLDEAARTAYRRRLAEIDMALADRDLSDARRRGQLVAEADALRAQLRSASGIAGRPRVGGATSERARVAVRKAIIAALARVADLDPDLARHLLQQTRTGSACRYDPPPDTSFTWAL